MMPEIKLHPFNPIHPGLLSEVRSGIESSFGIPTTIGEDLPIPRGAFSKEREQFQSKRFLAVLHRLNQDENAIRLGITDVDLYVPQLNFVFGEANPRARVAVFSSVRLDPRSYGEPPDDPLLIRRSLTEAIHELGHVFGLEHCPDPNCVMWFSNTLSETDRKGTRFCSNCSRILGKTRAA